MSIKKLTNEEIAVEEIGQTDISVYNQRVLIGLFFFCISVVPLMQTFNNFSNEALIISNAEDSIQNQEEPPLSIIERLNERNTDLLHTIENYEFLIEEKSLYKKRVIPIAQSNLLRIFKTGNEQTWVDKNNLYYKAANLYLTLPGFLDPKQLEARENNERVQANPLKAIVDFKKQLEEKGIHLMIIPVPPKASFTVANKNQIPLNNKSYNRLVDVLRKENIIVCDLFDLFKNNKFRNSGFLSYDTHWSPEAMQLAAKEVGRLLDSLSIEKGMIHYDLKKIKVENHGDLANMLSLENTNVYFDTQITEIEQITENNFLFRSNKQSDILVLGDSYSNIFSLGRMDWGESAGLTEHISAIMKKPVDRIVRNDDGAYATRKTLSNELKKGINRLDGKKIIIWQFAARELSLGNWKLFNFDLNEKYVSSNFFVPKVNSVYIVNGVVKGVSKIPAKGSVPYEEQVISIHISELTEIHSGLNLGQSVVYLLGMENNELTTAAGLRPGDTVKLKLYNWNDFAHQFGSFNRSDLEDDELALEDPCWGELID